MEYKSISRANSTQKQIQQCDEVEIQIRIALSSECGSIFTIVYKRANGCYVEAPLMNPYMNSCPDKSFALIEDDSFYSRNLVNMIDLQKGWLCLNQLFVLCDMRRH
jgi:hypothetical protein